MSSIEIGKIIKVKGVSYTAAKELEDMGMCYSCVARNNKYMNCQNFVKDGEDCTGVVFHEVLVNKTINKPTIQMNLELDLSKCILPVFFTVKNLRLQSLDAALKNQSDAYNVSVKDLPQETIEVLAEALKQEFIRRNTKVHDV